jgi:hypothetical protein
MKVPCKECLVLAVCIPKTTVKCDLLDKVACEVDVNASKHVVAAWWELVHEYLPRANAIRDSGGKYNLKKPNHI